MFYHQNLLTGIFLRYCVQVDWYFFDNGLDHSCCSQSSGGPKGLKFIAHRGQVFFLKLTADQVVGFHWIVGSTEAILL